MKEQVVNQIISKLNQVSESASFEYKNNKIKHGIGFCSIDDLLPQAMAQEIFEAMNPENSAWRRMKSFRENKLTTKQYDQFNPILKEVTFAFQDNLIINCVEKITGIFNQLPDQYLYAGGLSLMQKDDFLDPHIDNSHDQQQTAYRRLNLLYYVTPNWNTENGGHLELWDINVKKAVAIESRFNRLVLMETHHTSWHSVSKVIAGHQHRCCVSNYYFSKESPTGQDYRHVTSFMARPNQPFKRLLCIVDNKLRETLRVIKKTGFGKKDIYVQKP